MKRPTLPSPPLLLNIPIFRAEPMRQPVNRMTMFMMGNEGAVMMEMMLDRARERQKRAVETIAAELGQRCSASNT
jgi:hypothetical protein